MVYSLVGLVDKVGKSVCGRRGVGGVFVEWGGGGSGGGEGGGRDEALDGVCVGCSFGNRGGLKRSGGV